jgi:ubiquinone/menaquinone biosynthesis C-methylase UbiE
VTFDPAAVRERARSAYDTVAAEYADALAPHLEAHAVERHALSLFAELAGANARVLDVGCGPGHITAHLATLGVNASGLDLSDGMVREARARYPDIDFAQGSFQSLDDTGLDGIVAWYSIIHLPPTERPAAFAGFARALRPQGLALLAFQVGDEYRLVTQGYGHEVSVDVWRLDPATIEAELNDAGFSMVARTIRAPVDSEATPQAFVLARLR